MKTKNEQKEPVRPYAEWQGNFLWIYFKIKDQEDIFVSECSNEEKNQLMERTFKGKIKGFLLKNREMHTIDFNE